jgi:hypothetical protein
MSKDNTIIKLQALTNIMLVTTPTDQLTEECKYFGSSEKLVLEGEYFTVEGKGRAKVLIDAKQAKESVN